MGRVLRLWAMVSLVTAACASYSDLFHSPAQRHADTDLLARQRADSTPAPPLLCKKVDTPVVEDPTRVAEQKPTPQKEEQQVAFEFRGCHLGDLFNEAIAQEQGYMCSRSTLFERECINVREKIGHREVTIFYQLRNGKLAGIMILFPPDDYPVILASLVEKFGEPHQRTSKAVQNRTGAPLMNDTAYWHTDAGELTVRRYGSTIEDGSVTIRSPEIIDKS